MGLGNLEIGHRVIGKTDKVYIKDALEAVPYAQNIYYSLTLVRVKLTLHTISY